MAMYWSVVDSFNAASTGERPGMSLLTLRTPKSRRSEAFG